LSRDGAQQNAQQLVQQLLDAGRTMLALPATLDRVLARVEAGEIEIRLAENGPANGRSHRFRRRPADASRIAPAMFVLACSLAAAVVLLLNQVVVASWFCLGLAALAAASLLFRR